MHKIQAYILEQLVLAEKHRYSLIKPREVEGNRFAYHLKKLIGNGFIHKDGRYYSLTNKGKVWADKISLKNFEQRIQPKIVSMAVIKDLKGRILFTRRKGQPFINRDALPYGKIHFGEKLESAAQREIFEKTGLSIKNIVHRGEIYLTVKSGEEILTHMLCHIFSGKYSMESLQEESAYKNCFWEEVKKINFDNCVPGTKEILSVLDKEKKAFFREITVNAQK